VTDIGDRTAKVRENRLRRIAGRQGLQLTKSRRPTGAPGPYELVGPGGQAIVAGAIDDIEQWLAAPPGRIFAFRDDGDGDGIGGWTPRNPDEILPDGYVVGLSVRFPEASASPYAGRRLVYAYEDRESGRLEDDSRHGGYVYHLADGRARRATWDVHDALWGFPLSRAATSLVTRMKALDMSSPGTLIGAYLSDPVAKLADAQGNEDKQFLI